jgi:hypothetical protein
MKKEVTLGIICTLLVCALSPAATLTVPGDYTTIQAALDAAAPLDIIEVDDGTYTGDGNKNLVLRNAVTVRSASGRPENCIIDCEGNGRGFRFYAGQDLTEPNTPANATQNFVVSGFTIRNGYAPDEDNDPNITRSAGNGGGIVIDAGYPVISNCIIRDCYTVGNGGGIFSNGTGGSGARIPLIRSCVIYNNLADNGGGIGTDGPSRILNCLIIGNSALTNGGAMFLQAGPSLIDLCTVAENYGSGSGIRLTASQTFTNCILWELISGSNVTPVNCFLFDSTIRGTNCLYGYPIDFPDEAYVGFTAGPFSSTWGTLGNYYLNPWQPSPAIDSGSGTITQYSRYGIDSGAAFTDPQETPDWLNVDMGYHYPLYNGPQEDAILRVIIDSNPAHGRVEVQGQTWDPNGVYTVDRPSVQTLTAIPDAGYRVRYWVGTYDDGIFNLDNLVRYVGIFSLEVEVHCSFELDIPKTLNYPGQYADLNYAILAARRGDTIIVHPGIYRLPGYDSYMINGAWDMISPCVTVSAKAITIRSVAPDDPCTVAATVFEPGPGFSTVFSLENCTRDTVISGLTIRNAYLAWAANNGTSEHPEGFQGAGTYGAGMQIVGSGTISNCVFRNCKVRSANGGNGIVVNNIGYDGGMAGFGGGGAAYVEGSPLFKNTTFVDCNALGGNGGNGGLGRDRWGRGGNYRFWTNSGVVGRTDFASGTRVERQCDGGAVFIRTGDTEFEGCTFEHCDSSSGVSGTGSVPRLQYDVTTAGGAVYVGSNQSDGQRYHGVYIGTASAKFTGCTFANNRTRLRPQAAATAVMYPYVGFGGAVAADDTASLTFSNCTFGPSATGTQGNMANLGGSIYWFGQYNPTSAGAGSMMINGCSFTRGGALQGGALYGQMGTLSMLDCTFDRNIARISTLGGGADANSTLGASILCQGGAMYLGSVSSYVGDSIFTLNEASHSGGALCVAGFNQQRMPIPRVFNNLFAGNSADRAGGAIIATDGSEPNIACNTIAYNRATGSGYLTGSGGGVSVTAGSRVQVYDCLIWGNTAFVGPQFSLVDPNGNGNYQNSGADIKYSLLQGGQSNIATDVAGNYLVYEDSNISGFSDPDFVYDYATQAEQFVDDYALANDSPCVGVGSLDLESPDPTVQPILPLGRYAYTLRVDNFRDMGIIDLGYHRKKPGTYPRGDINYSGTVNTLDLDALGQFWLATTCAYPDWCEGSDLNRDGVVNLNDDAILATLYGVGDVNAPTPDPSYWLLSPAADSSSSITMTAATAVDNSGNTVEYYFDCVTDSEHSSGWQVTSTYRDTGLSTGGEYGYRVRTRDTDPCDPSHHNVTGWSPTLYGFVGEDGRAPIPNPSQWATAPYALSATAIAMAAQTAVDASGVEYYFRCESGTSGYDSGWQENPTFINTGLLPYTTYTYTVRTRDESAAQNMGDSSVAKSAITLAQPDVNCPTPTTAQWYTKPFAASSTSVQMRAVTAYDPSGVEYYFECTLGGHTYDSGWQTSPGYSVGNLAPNTEYSFRVLVRDRSINRNACTPSMEATVYTYYTGGGPTTPPTPDPMQWNIAAEQISLPDGVYHNMQSVVATDIDGGIQYYFQCLTAPSLSSGWINAPVYAIRVGDVGQLKTYTWRVKARDIYGSETGWSVSAVAGLSTPPTPNPMQWDITPAQQIMSDGIYHSMIAAVATDADGAVEYYFDCTTNPLVSSSWQSSPEYSVKIGDLGEPNAYGWRVKARDIYGVETDWSPTLIAGEGTAPMPNPAQWDTVPTPRLESDGVYHGMRAVTETDTDGGIQYYFQCMTAPSKSSGWQSSSSYSVKVCGTGETRTYTWRVKAMDALGNETAWSTALVAGPIAPTPNPMQWDLPPVQELLSDGYYHSMDAVLATDADGGVQYYFDCMTAPSMSSGWRSSRSYSIKVGNTSSPKTYTWRVKARDIFGTETDWSPMTTVVGAGVAPLPNPMQWVVVPTQAVAADGIYHNMVCATATNNNGGIQYYFDCITNSASTSGWVTSTSYSVKVGELGQPKTYSWRVKARDAYGTETAWSTTVTTTLVAPVPSPMQWAATSAATVTGATPALTTGVPTETLATGLLPDGVTSYLGYWHCMTAVTAVDSTGSTVGVQYYFECTGNSSISSGWIDLPYYQVCVGSPSWPHTYGWRVKARDVYGTETGWSAIGQAGISGF